MLRKLASTIMMLAILSPATLAQDSILLRLKPKAGSVYVYRSAQEVTISGIGKPSTQRSGSTLTTKVLSSNAQFVKLQTSMSDLTGTQDTRELKGFKLTISLTPLYRILSVASSGGGQTAALVAKGMDSAMRMTPTYPTKRLHVGDSWPLSLDMKELLETMAPGTVTFNGGSTLNLRVKVGRIERRNKNSLAYLEMTGAGKLTMEANKQRIPIDYSVRGTLVVDLATGMHTNTDSTLEQKIKTPSGTVLMKVRSTTKLVKGP